MDHPKTIGQQPKTANKTFRGKMKHRPTFTYLLVNLLYFQGTTFIYGSLSVFLCVLKSLCSSVGALLCFCVAQCMKIMTNMDFEKRRRKTLSKLGLNCEKSSNLLDVRFKTIPSGMALCLFITFLQGTVGKYNTFITPDSLYAIRCKKIAIIVSGRKT